MLTIPWLVESMASGISRAMETLLKVYGVQHILDVGTNLQTELTIMQSSMDAIRLSNQQTSASISSLSGALRTIYDLISPEMSQLCATDLGQSLNLRCKNLQTDSELLKIQFDASEILVDPPAVLNFLLEEFNINLDDLLSQLTQVSVEITKIEKEIHGKVLEFLDLDRFLEPIISFWRDIKNSTNNLITNLDSNVKAIDANLSSIHLWIIIAVYLPVALFSLLMFVGILFYFLNLIEAIDLKMFSTNVQYNQRSGGSNVCNNLGFTLYSTLNLVIIFVVSILVVVIMPSSAILATEGCVYLDTPNGTAKTDYLLDKYLAQEWPAILENIFSNSDANNFIELISPTGILKAATVECRPLAQRGLISGGLLNAIGWTSIVNVGKLLSDKTLMDQIEKGEGIMIDEVKKIDIIGLLPKDLNSMVNLARNITIYFDKMDYSASIEQLKPDRIPVDRLTQFEIALLGFGNDVIDIGLNSGNVIVSGASLLHARRQHISSASVAANSLRTAFESVQDRRNLTMGIDDIIRGLNITVLIVGNETLLLAPIPEVYQKLVKFFLAELDTYLTAELTFLTSSLYPCADLYYTAETLLNVVCRRNGLLARLFSWSLALAITDLFISIFFFNMFHLFFVQSHRFRRFGAKNALKEIRVKLPTPSVHFNQPSHIPKYERPAPYPRQHNIQ